MVSGFEVTITLSDTEAVVRLQGELDVATAPLLRDQLHGLSRDGVRTVAVDLAELDFIDSTGLAVLIGALKHLREHGGDLTLRSPKPSARKLFEIAGLTEIIAIT